MDTAAVDRRRLMPADALLCGEIRLEALLRDPEAFGSPAGADDSLPRSVTFV